MRGIDFTNQEATAVFHADCPVCGNHIARDHDDPKLDHRRLQFVLVEAAPLVHLRVGICHSCFVGFATEAFGRLSSREPRLSTGKVSSRGGELWRLWCLKHGHYFGMFKEQPCAQCKRDDG